MGIWDKVKQAVGDTFSTKVTKGLKKTATKVSEGIQVAVGAKARMDAQTREALEEALLGADVGMAATTDLLDDLQDMAFSEPLKADEVKAALAGLIAARLKPMEQELKFGKAKPFVILVAGVNGSGKTTTIGKLAAKWQDEGKKVVVAAADTFRAGAVGQLAVWAERAGVVIVGPDKEGADPAGVAYAAVEKALKAKADIVMIDTAGRLSNRRDLMDELAKIRRVVQKLIPEAPHAGLLVLDGTMGQATLTQVRKFGPVGGITGLVVTKLDSSAKAGFLLALGNETKLPVHFIGVGEKAEDLGGFEAGDFAAGVTGLS